MKIIVGGRASGKTTKLIQESAETGYRIVTFNHDAAKEIYMQAKDLGYDILRPISAMEYVLAPNSFEQDGILVDDLENTLVTIWGQKIHTATFCSECMPLTEISTKGRQTKFIRGETVSKIEPEFVLRNENFEIEKRVKKVNEPDPGVGITTTNATDDGYNTINAVPSIYSPMTECEICGEEFKFDGRSYICPKCREAVVKIRKLFEEEKL